MILVIVDHPASVSGPSGEPLSVLTFPLGRCTLLESFLAGFPAHVDRQVFVLRRFDCSDTPETNILDSTVEIIRWRPSEPLGDQLSIDPTDEVIVADAAHWPIGPVRWSRLLKFGDPRKAVLHGVAARIGGAPVRERVDYDADGKIRRVQRVITKSPLAWSRHSALVLSRVPAWCLNELLFESLPDLRERLLRCGLLGEHVPLNTGHTDATTTAGLLTAQQALLEVCHSRHRGRDCIWVGSACRIAKSATLTGPIVLGDGVVVDENARVVGPATIGSGSRVEAHSLVFDSLICPNSLVPSGTAAYHCIVAGAWPPKPGTANNGQALRLSREASQWEADPEDGTYVYSAVKRALDVILSGAGLLMLSPLFLLVAIALWLDSKGPVLYAQRREGRNGREFKCIKFRSMIVQGHQLQRKLAELNKVDGPQFKLDHDPRVTRVGRFLRASNIDELPQLINVLLGQMSMVGPRPSPPKENSICIPWRQARLSVPPGITGLWQICRRCREESDFHQWVYYDLAYVRHRSLWLDIRILLATVLTLGGQWSVPPAWILGRTASAAFSGQAWQRRTAA